MPRHVVMNRANRSLGGGRVRIRLPEVAVYLPSNRELSAAAAREVERDLRRRVRGAPGGWTGLGRAVEHEIVADEHGVRVPASSAVRRMQQVAPQTQLGARSEVLERVARRYVEAGVQGKKPKRGA